MSAANLGHAVYELRTNNAPLEQGIRRGEEIARSGSRRIGGLLEAGLAVGLGVTTFNAGLVITRRAFDAATAGAFGFNETLDATKRTWATFLGNTTAAEKQVARLFEFAAETPFDFQQVNLASVTLQAFGKAALNNEANLKRFGGAAVGIQGITGGLTEGLQQATFWSGRLYEALQSGRPIGEAALRLQELTLLPANIRSRIERLQKENVDPDTIFKVYLEQLDRFVPLLEEQSKSATTQIATLRDRLLKASADIGRPIFDKGIEGLVALNAVLTSPAAAEFQKRMTTQVAAGVKAVSDRLQDPATRDALREIAEGAVRAFGAIRSGASSLADTFGPVIAGVAQLTGWLNELSGNNLLTFGVLALGATRFRTQLRLLAEVMTGQTSILRVQRDEHGKLVSAHERAAAAAVRQAQAEDELTRAQEKLRRATLAVRHAQEDATAARAVASRAGDTLNTADRQVQRSRYLQQGDSDTLRTARDDLATTRGDIAAAGGIDAAHADADRYADALKQVGRLTKEVNGATSAAAAAQAQVIAALDRRRLAEQALIEATQRFAEAEQRAREATIQRAAASARLAAANADVTKFQNREVVINRRIGRAETKRDDATAVLATATPGSADFSNALRRQKTALLDLRDATDDLAQNTDDLTDAQGRQARMLTELTAREQALQNSRRELKNASAQQRGAQGEFDTATKAYETASQRAAAADARRTRALADLNAQQAVVTADGGKSVALLERLERQTKEYERASKQAEGSTREMARALEARARAERELESAERAVGRANDRGYEALRRQAQATEEVGHSQGRLARTMREGSDIFNRVGIAVGTFTAALFGLDQAAQVVTGRGLKDLLISLTEYGDLLGNARKEAEEFAKSQRGSADAAGNFDKEIAAAQKNLEALRKTQRETGLEIDESTGQYRDTPNLFTEEGRRAIAQRVNAFLTGKARVGVGVDLQIAEAQKKLDELTKARHVEINVRLQQDFGDVAPTTTQAELTKRAIDNAAARPYNNPNEGRGPRVVVPDEATLRERAAALANTTFFETTGRELFDQFARGFKSGDADSLGDLSGLVKAQFGADGVISLDEYVRIGKAEIIFAELINQFRTTGEVGEATMERLRATLGDTFDPTDVETYIRTLGRLMGALGDVETAQAGLDSMEAELKKVNRSAKDVISPIEKELNTAQRSAATNARGFEDQLRPLNGTLKETQRLAEDAARAWTKTTEGLQEELRLLQVGAKANQRGFEERIEAAQAELGVLRDTAETNERAAQAEIKQAQAGVESAQELARANSKRFATEIKGIQADLDAAQESARANAARFAEEIEGLQGENEKAQKRATENAAAYQAVLEGTTEEFQQQNTELEEVTRSIIRRWDADVAGARRLKEATAQRSTGAERQQRKDLLAFDEAIAAARTKGDRVEVARLTRQRDAYSKRSGQEIDLLRSRAAVAQDEFDKRAELLEKEARQTENTDKIAANAAERRLKDKQAEAEAQEKLDKAAVETSQKLLDGAQKRAAAQAEADQNAIEAAQALVDEAEKRGEAQAATDRAAIEASEKRLEGVQAEQRAQEKLDTAAIEAKQEQIRLVQVEAKQVADDYAERIRKQQEVIRGIEEAAEKQKLADDANIRSIQDRLTNAKEYWAGEQETAQQNVDSARDALKAAKDRVSTEQAITETIKDRVKQQEEFNKKVDEYIDKLRKEGLLPSQRPYQAPNVEENIVRSFGGTNTGLVPNPPQAPPPAAPPPVPDEERVAAASYDPTTGRTYVPTTGEEYARPSSPPPAAPLPVARQATAVDPDLVGAASYTYNQNAPLVGTAHIREEADIDLLAQRLSEEQMRSFEQARRGGVTPGRVNR